MKSEAIECILGYTLTLSHHLDDISCTTRVTDNTGVLLYERMASSHMFAKPRLLVMQLVIYHHLHSIQFIVFINLKKQELKIYVLSL